jgi:uncharacterized protein (DUF924 family)
MTEIGPKEVLDFWFKETPPAKWFASDPAFDAEIRRRFEAAWRLGCSGKLAHWEHEKSGALALILLFDQFPRNMFRGHADQFSTDHLALVIAKQAVDLSFDDQLQPEERNFLYMPFMHSEALADQKRSVQLFTALGDDNQLGFARKHHDVIERFGRFPHRNRMLGRESTPQEVEFLKTHSGF